MGFLREAVRAWLGTNDERISDGRDVRFGGLGGAKFEICRISNGYLIVSARSASHLPDTVYIEKAEDIGAAVTAQLVAYKLQGEAEVQERHVLLAQAGNKLASANYNMYGQAIK